MMKKVTFIYFASLALFSAFSYAFVDINLSYLKAFYTGYYLSHRVLLSAVYIVLIFILFGCFYFFIKNADKLRDRLGKIVLLVFLITILSYPAALTFDIFNYMTTAKLTFTYLENPYIIYPIEFIGDPYLEFTRAANKTVLYGPLWVLLTGIPHFAGLGNFVLTLFSFKTFIALFYIGTFYLLQKVDKNAVLFFALNPLVIIETLVSTHNDIVMIFFALLAFYFIQTKKIFSVTSFICSVLIKFATVFLVPVYFLSFFNKIKKENIYKYSAISMFIIFLLSPLREELYPWYAIWFIVFTSFLYKNRFLQNLVLTFSLGLMLRYIPYMATGNYFGSTPIIRNALMIVPIAVFLISIWLKKYSPLR